MIDAVLDLPPEKRGAYMDHVSDGDPALRSDLERMLHESTLGDSLIDRAAAERFALLFEDLAGRVPDVLGDRIAEKGPDSRQDPTQKDHAQREM